MTNNIIRKIFPKQIKGYSIGIHISVIMLSLFGLMMVMSANGGPGVSAKDFLPIFIKEAGFIFVSYWMMIHAARLFSFNKFKKYMKLIMGATIGFNLFALVFADVGGARAWIRFGGITIQPSEFTKIVMVLVFAAFLADRKYRPGLKFIDFAGVPVIFLIANLFIITILQSDLGSAVVIFFMSFFVAVIPQNKALTRGQTWLTVIVIFGFGLVVFLSTPAGVAMLQSITFLPEYMVARFQTVSDPFYDTLFRGYHVFNGFISFTSGGWLGKGLGSSLGKHGFIPEARTDFILAIIVEELGMFGLFFILFFYGVILVTLLREAKKMRYEKDKMILIGVASYLMIHFLFNVGGITALIPLTGVPLLLISSGASSKMSFLIAIGIAQSCIAKAPKVPVRKKVSS